VSGELKTDRTVRGGFLSEFVDSRYGRLTAILILVGTTLHLCYSTHLELVGDEAYYWLWSRHPDICYVDKGPMIAWLIKLGTTLFGHTVFGIRFFAILLAAITACGVFLLAKRLFSDRIGFWAVASLALSPLFAVGSVLMTVDSLYVCFWTLAALAFWRAKNETRVAPWALTGIAVGLGLLSKYTAVIELFSFAFFCLWHAPSRSHLRRPPFYVLLGTSLLFLLPAVLWNYKHGWPTTHWLLHRGGLDTQSRLHPLSLVNFLGEQAGVLSPLFFFGVLLGLYWPYSEPSRLAETRYLIALFSPLFFIYLILACRYVAQPNWTAAAYIGGLILLIAKWDRPVHTKRWAKRLAVVALVLAAIETAILHETRWLHLPRGRDPLDRARGWSILASSVARLQRETAAQFVLSNSYMTASLLSFYLPGRPEASVPKSAVPFNQLEFWAASRHDPTGCRALLIEDVPEISPSFKGEFSDVQSVGSVEEIRAGRTLKRYYVFLARFNR
jgi:4-amino-4-deoxy-L-arabinose transferase-like glycosyltransferase